MAQQDRPLTRAEVAELFRVAPATVTKWADKGLLHPFRTPGNTRRYARAEVMALLNGDAR